MKTLSGVVPVMPAPFKEDGALDLEAVPNLIEFAVRAGVKQVCLPAYGSEFYKLTDDERVHLVTAAVKAAAGRINIVAQSNHGSAQVAAGLAQRMEAVGADFIGLALPRLFPVSDDDLVRYAATVCDAVRLPVMLQDFNPGGATCGPEFCVKLHERCGNFRYIKLEEPRMAPKMEAIHEQTHHEVGVLEGWGGLYMMELVPRGCHGSIPGFVLADPLQRVYEQIVAGQMNEAFSLFCEVVPFITFSLENFELYHHAEKRLLVRRGVLKSAHVRDNTTYPDPSFEQYLDFLADRLWDTLARHGFAKNPLA